MYVIMWYRYLLKLFVSNCEKTIILFVAYYGSIKTKIKNSEQKVKKIYNSK